MLFGYVCSASLTSPINRLLILAGSRSKCLPWPHRDKWFDQVFLWVTWVIINQNVVCSVIILPKQVICCIFVDAHTRNCWAFPAFDGFEWDLPYGRGLSVDYCRWLNATLSSPVGLTASDFFFDSGWEWKKVRKCSNFSSIFEIYPANTPLHRQKDAH